MRKDILQTMAVWLFIFGMLAASTAWVSAYTGQEPLESHRPTHDCSVELYGSCDEQAAEEAPESQPLTIAPEIYIEESSQPSGK